MDSYSLRVPLTEAIPAGAAARPNGVSSKGNVGTDSEDGNVVFMFKGCWSCGSHAACFDDCDCAKCVDPEDYEDWRQGNPAQYESWLERQQVDECGCPGCY